MLLLAAVARAAPVALPGAAHLDEVASLTFTITYEGDASVSRTWTWAPAAGVPADPLFLADTFWLDPAIHVGWAAPGSIRLDDHGTTVSLGYPPFDGGGDVHELAVDAAGAVTAWTYRRAGGSPAFTATFEGRFQVGPLRLAAVRAVTGDPHLRTVRASATWIPSGTAISAGPDRPPVVFVGAAGCRIGEARVGWAASAARAVPPGSGAFDHHLLVARPDGTTDVPWSSSTLGTADDAWARDLAGCDFGALSAADLAAALAPLPDPDRAAAVVAVWAWGRASGAWSSRADALLPWVRRDAVGCAIRGECAALYADIGRAR